MKMLIVEFNVDEAEQVKEAAITAGFEQVDIATSHNEVEELLTEDVDLILVLGYYPNEFVEDGEKLFHSIKPEAYAHQYVLKAGRLPLNDSDYLQLAIIPEHFSPIVETLKRKAQPK